MNEEYGILTGYVTLVQTCAHPICLEPTGRQCGQHIASTCKGAATVSGIGGIIPADDEYVVDPCLLQEGDNRVQLSTGERSDSELAYNWELCTDHVYND